MALITRERYDDQEREAYRPGNVRQCDHDGGSVALLLDSALLGQG